MRGHIQQRGKTSWRVKVFVGRDAAGGRRYVQRTVRGTRREAERELAPVVVEVDEWRRAAAAPMTYCDVLDRWLDVRRGRRGSRTRQWTTLRRLCSGGLPRSGSCSTAPTKRATWRDLSDGSSRTSSPWSGALQPSNSAGSIPRSICSRVLPQDRGQPTGAYRADLARVDRARLPVQPVGVLVACRQRQIDATRQSRPTSTVTTIQMAQARGVHAPPTE
jgi:hypothetical protein